ncbi:hypothetical protein NEFER01_0563 [Nematocida sp. LUAm1]|nr:hypothetical protein NEFER02_0434 [Nematocida sp. LUAm2]KAI5177288.1 hypothetical protein NEFER01_0563 [Nematocida sp. LUAm1]
MNTNTQSTTININNFKALEESIKISARELYSEKNISFRMSFIFHEYIKRVSKEYLLGNLARSSSCSIRLEDRVTKGDTIKEYLSIFSFNKDDSSAELEEALQKIDDFWQKHSSNSLSSEQPSLSRKEVVEKNNLLSNLEKLIIKHIGANFWDVWAIYENAHFSDYPSFCMFFTDEEVEKIKELGRLMEEHLVLKKIQEQIDFSSFLLEKDEEAVKKALEGSSIDFLVSSDFLGLLDSSDFLSENTPRDPLKLLESLNELQNFLLVRDRKLKDQEETMAYLHKRHSKCTTYLNSLHTFIREKNAICLEKISQKAANEILAMMSTDPFNSRKNFLIQLMTNQAEKLSSDEKKKDIKDTQNALEQAPKKAIVREAAVDESLLQSGESHSSLPTQPSESALKESPQPTGTKSSTSTAGRKLSAPSILSHPLNSTVHSTTAGPSESGLFEVTTPPNPLHPTSPPTTSTSASDVSHVTIIPSSSNISRPIAPQNLQSSSQQDSQESTLQSLQGHSLKLADVGSAPNRSHFNSTPDLSQPNRALDLVRPYSTLDVSRSNRALDHIRHSRTPSFLEQISSSPLSISTDAYDDGELLYENVSSENTFARQMKHIAMVVLFSAYISFFILLMSQMFNGSLHLSTWSWIWMSATGFFGTIASLLIYPALYFTTYPVSLRRTSRQLRKYLLKTIVVSCLSMLLFNVIFIATGSVHIGISFIIWASIVCGTLELVSVLYRNYEEKDQKRRRRLKGFLLIVGFLALSLLLFYAAHRLNLKLNNISIDLPEQIEIEVK